LPTPSASTFADVTHKYKPLYSGDVPETFIRATASSGVIRPSVTATAPAAPALRCLP